MRIKVLSLAILFIFSSITLINAQKYGYLNSTQLLAEMPEVKTADQELQTFQNSLLEKGQSMMATFQKEYEVYATKANSGEMSQVEMAQKEAELGQKQQEIRNYELEVQQKVLQKREELYKPILDKVQNVLDALGAEKNYTMIFDSGVGSLLYANDSEDVMAEVKSRLGI